jgi:hypothetical protein
VKNILAYIHARRIILALLGIYTLLLLLNALHIEVWLPSCPFYNYLGVECMGCGVNRALIALLHLQPAEAWSYNPLVFLYLPLLICCFSFDFYKYCQT